MKKVYRRLLFFLATTAFLVAAPLVILYAVGYRTTLNADPLPVGVVLVETVPRRATVFADDRRVGTTPRALSNLPAGPVRIRIERDGYEVWEKTLDVAPGRAVEARDIRLFPREPRVRTILTQVQSFALSPSRQLVAVVDDDAHVQIVDLVGAPVSQALQSGEAPVAVLWSPNSASVLVETNRGQFYLLPVGEALPELVPQLRGARDVVWDPRIPGRLLYLDATGDLLAFNVTSEARVMLAEDVVSFGTSSRTVYAVHSDGRLSTATFQGVVTEADVVKPEGSVRRVLATPGGELALQMDDGRLWVRLPNGEWQLVSERMLTGGWSPDEQLLFVQPDEQSLHMYNVADERTPLPLRELVLVTRLTRTIKDPQWFAGGRHLLYQVDDELLITEIDTRDHPITYQVDTTNLGAPSPAVGLEGQTLLYLKQIDGIRRLVGADLILE